MTTPNRARREFILSVFGSVATINQFLRRNGKRHTWDTVTDGEERWLYDEAVKKEKP